MAYCAKFYATESKDRIFGLAGLLPAPLPAPLFDYSTRGGISSLPRCWLRCSSQGTPLYALRMPV